jgi:hypothetical protein
MPVAVSVTPVMRPAPTKTVLFGAKAGANLVAIAAKTVEAPTMTSSMGVETISRMRRPTKVPAKRPSVLQLALEKSK